jgi:hypothetical protein
VNLYRLVVPERVNFLDQSSLRRLIDDLCSGQVLEDLLGKVARDKHPTRLHVMSESVPICTVT